MSHSKKKPEKSNNISRRKALSGFGALAGLSVVGSSCDTSNKTTNINTGKYSSSEVYRQIHEKVNNTVFIDTHEHLMDESDRLSETPPKNLVNDWSILFSHYIDSDLVSAGMSYEDMEKFKSKEVDPIDKWPLMEPYWPYVKNTGYGQASAISIRDLYGIENLDKTTIPELQQKFDNLLKPGLYKYVLQEKAKIESCHVNSLTHTINETESPLLLMQDLRIDGFFSWFNIKEMANAFSLQVTDLDDWYKVINAWFNKYGDYAIGVKAAIAYSRDIDFLPTEYEEAAPVFKRMLNGDELKHDQRKKLEDHLFWYAVDKSVEYNLPVKIHTGYYAGENNMPLSRVAGNTEAASDLCRHKPEATFVFFHIAYPYYEELLAVSKQYTNAVLDMCWAWIINPVASVDFLKKFIVTCPNNKVLTLGGDYIPVEPILGHTVMARQGVIQSLCELVDQQWISLDEALKLTDDLMHQNARKIFDMPNKEKYLKSHSWEI
ncbi:amidohydrolase family protein [Bacteroidota bacterium]